MFIAIHADFLETARNGHLGLESKRRLGGFFARPVIWICGFTLIGSAKGADSEFAFHPWCPKQASRRPRSSGIARILDCGSQKPPVTATAACGQPRRRGCLAIPLRRDPHKPAVTCIKQYILCETPRPQGERSASWKAGLVAVDHLYFRRPQGIQGKESPLRSLAGLGNPLHLVFCDSEF